MSANDHLSPAQFKIKITPAQHNALGAYLGDSEYLNSAEDAGMQVSKSHVHLPDEAATHFGHFVNMRKEIAEDNRSMGETNGYDRAFEGLHQRVSAALGDRMPRKFS